jgi:replicative DNA helicase
LAARTLATRLGYKARILEWDHRIERGATACRLAAETGGDFPQSVGAMIRSSKAFSPFREPDREHRLVREFVRADKGKGLLGCESGFDRMDRALDGIRGISIMGGLPKAGKSCFFMQISTEMALRKTPVIYYDFENGRRKIYLRTLARLSSLSERALRTEELDTDGRQRLEAALGRFNSLLRYFRVVTDRQLNPDLMRRQIDFLQHETGTEAAVVVLDSLHKLPFKELTERRTGIDSWLRQLEAIRDGQNVSFLVISELARGKEGGYDERPDLGSFKESGDIEYSADNAMILMPGWDPLGPISSEQRVSTLWMIASRENSPGKIADYRLEYPYWRFAEL